MKTNKYPSLQQQVPEPVHKAMHRFVLCSLSHGSSKTWFPQNFKPKSPPNEAPNQFASSLVYQSK